MHRLHPNRAALLPPAAGMPCSPMRSIGPQGWNGVPVPRASQDRVRDALDGQRRSGARFLPLCASFHVV